jgi:hypothetical protein
MSLASLHARRDVVSLAQPEHAFADLERTGDASDESVVL